MSDVTVTPQNPHAGQTRFDGVAGTEDQARRMAYMSGLDPASSLWVSPDSLRKDAIGANIYKGLRSDSPQTAFFARQLEYIFTQTYDIKYPQLKARQAVPVDTRVPSGAESFTYRSYEKKGQAKTVQSYANDFPNADVAANEFSQKIVSGGASYQFSIQDMRAAAMAGVPLEAKKAEAARWALENWLEDLAGSGDASTLTPMLGIANAFGVPTVAKVSPSGTWAAQIAAALAGGTLDATVASIVADVTTLFNSVVTTSKEVHKPTALGLPLAAYQAISTTPRSTKFTQDTILSYLYTLLRPEGLNEIFSWGRILDTAGSGSTGRALMYEKSADNEGLIISQEFEQFAPQPHGMLWVVPCHMRTGAVEVRYPKSAAYMDGI